MNHRSLATLSARLAQISIGEPPHRSVPSPAMAASDALCLWQMSDAIRSAWNTMVNNQTDGSAMQDSNEILLPYGLTCAISKNGLRVIGKGWDLDL